MYFLLVARSKTEIIEASFSMTVLITYMFVSETSFRMDANVIFGRRTSGSLESSHLQAC